MCTWLVHGSCRTTVSNQLIYYMYIYGAHIFEIFMRQAKQWNSNQSLSERRRYLFTLIRKINDIRSLLPRLLNALLQYLVQRHVTWAQWNRNKFYSYVIRLMGALTANNYKSQQVVIRYFWWRKHQQQKTTNDKKNIYMCVKRIRNRIVFYL